MLYIHIYLLLLLVLLLLFPHTNYGIPHSNALVEGFDKPWDSHFFSSKVTSPGFCAAHSAALLVLPPASYEPQAPKGEERGHRSEMFRASARGLNQEIVA